MLPAALPAQGRSELAASAGLGNLVVNGGGGTTPVLSFSYRFHFTEHLSAEGALDVFTYKLKVGPPGQSSIFRDGYLGAEAAVAYDLRSNRQTKRWLPFMVAGLGRTTTDFTEIPSTLYLRLGIGASYHFSERVGVRMEIRDEIIRGLYSPGNPGGNLPSLRVGIVYRF
jgi:hypothetical protein